MEALDIARWQFGITTVYHFMLVPLTLGLGMAIVIMQTIWVRTGDDRFLRMVKFWGKLYLINFILGVATGLVQEFQFGMAWSEYSRFVGDVFGAPRPSRACLHSSPSRRSWESGSSDGVACERVCTLRRSGAR